MMRAAAWLLYVVLILSLAWLGTLVSDITFERALVYLLLGAVATLTTDNR